ncbi:MAG: hypothetical protein ACN4GT_12725 [Gammaproteobacteria bacterium]
MPDGGVSDGSGPVVLAVATAPERRGIEHLETATHAANRIEILQTGVGPLQADAIRAHLVNAGARGLVSLGTCGGLDPAISCGTLLIPAELIGADDQRAPVDMAWRKRVTGLLAPTIEWRDGPLVTLDRVLRTPEQKRQVRDRTGAVVIDMESATLQRAAALAGIPFIAVRVALDSADETIPSSVAAGVDRDGNPTPLRLLRTLCAHPTDIPGLVRLAAGLRVANAALEDAIRQAADALVDPR